MIPSKDSISEVKFWLEKHNLKKEIQKFRNSEIPSWWTTRSTPTVFFPDIVEKPPETEQR
jgi:hypothetical protein